MDNQRIADEIARMDRLELIGIFRHILEGQVPYSNNDNGIYIHMQRIPASTRDKIVQFIEYSKASKSYMEDQERKKEELKETLRNDILAETPAFNRYYENWRQDDQPAFLGRNSNV